MNYIWLIILLVVMSPIDNPIKQARDNYKIVSYSCTFIKQEVVNGKSMPTEIADVFVLEKPFSVYMVFQNPTQIRRLLYVENKFIKNGKECVIVEPHGLLRILLPSLWLPYDDPIILRKSRSTIKSFGFKNILDRILESLEEHYHLELINNVLKHDDGRFVLYVSMNDKLGIPVSLHIYEDGQMIGNYVYTNIKLNIGLTAKDFKWGDKLGDI